MLSQEHKRNLLFLVGCLGTRSLLAYAAKYVDKTKLKYMGYIALVPAIVWLYMYFIKPRTTGPEVFGGKIWWNNWRIVHAMVYILFSILAIQGKDYAYMPLLADVFIGFIAFTMHHSHKNINVDMNLNVTSNVENSM